MKNLLQHNQFLPINPLLQTLLLALIFINSALFFVYPDIDNKLYLLASLICIFIYAKHYKNINLGFVLPLFFIGLIVQFMPWLINYSEGNPFIESDPKFHRMGVWFLFIPIAFILGTYKKNYIVLFILSVIGIFLTPLLENNFLEQCKILYYGIDRPEFGFTNAQHSSVIFGVIIINIAIFFEKTIKYKIISAIIILIFLTSLISIIYLRTRAVYIGLTIFSLYYISIAVKKYSIKTLSLLFIFLFILLTYNQEMIKNRMSLENPIKEITKNENQILKSSIGIRIASWKSGLELSKEKPFFGWGGNGDKEAIKRAKQISEHNKKIFGHLHNSYIDTLVNYGVIGLIYLVVIMTMPFLTAFKLYKNQNISDHNFQLITSFTLFWLTVNIFESYMYFKTGIFLYIIFSSIPISYYFTLKNKKI